MFCRIARLAEVFGQSVYELCAKVTAVNDIRSVCIFLQILFELIGSNQGGICRLKQWGEERMEAPKYISVKFCQYVASLYLHIFTNFGRFILIFNKMALIFLGVPIVFNVFSFKFHQVKSS